MSNRAKFIRCPSYTGGDNLGGTGYGVNRRLMFTSGFRPESGNSRRTFRAFAARFFLVMREFPNFPVAGQTGETISIEPPSDWLPSPTVDFRHQKMACFVWGDGHAKAVRRTEFVQNLPRW